MTSALFQVSPVNTFVLCVVTRVLMGFCTGLVFAAVKKLDKHHTWSYFVGSISAPLLNTLFFMGYIVLVFYNTDFVQGLVASKGASNPLMFVVLLVGVQGIIEAAACGVLGAVICKALSVVLRNQVRTIGA